MDVDFAMILVLATFISGIIWGLDALFWAPRRRMQLQEGNLAEEAGAGAPEGTPAQAREPMVVEYARSFFPILLAVLVLRSFVVEPFRIPSGSMLPTLQIGDFILVNKFAYGIRLPVINTKVIGVGEPHRGDVVVFRYPRDPSVDYIKRVIGLPGDHILYEHKQLYINGKPMPIQQEGPYVGHEEEHTMPGTVMYKEQLGKVGHQILLNQRFDILDYPCLNHGKFTVPAGHYFMMGDNRDNSNDSRFWCAVPEKNLVGKAFVIWMNFNSENGGIDWSRIGDVIH